MTLETDETIATGRTWRDLPAAPPEADSIEPVTESAAPVAPADVADTTPLPVVAPPSPTEPRGERSPWPWVVGLAATVAVVALLFAWSPWSGSSNGELLGLDEDSARALADVEEPVAAVAAGLLPSVVQIERDGALGAVGSGFVYEPGRVLTAAHVVAGAREVTVRTSDGTELVGIVLGGDPGADIAVVAIESDIDPASLAIGETPQVGQLAVAIGSPLGFDQSVTSGIVSAVDREIRIGGTLLDGLIQTDAPIDQGSSGGPLADRRGRVIGVNVAIATSSGGSDGLGFAVGIDKAVEIAAGFTGTDPRPGSLDGGAGGLLDDPGPLPPELRGLLDELLGGADPNGPLGDGDLSQLLDDLLGGADPNGLLGDGDLSQLLDELLGGGDLDGLFDQFADPGSGSAEELLPPEVLDLLLQLLGGDGTSLGDGSTLDDLFDLFLEEG